MRITGTDWREDGLSVKDAQRVAQILEENGLDYLYIGGGITTG